MSNSIKGAFTPAVLMTRVKRLNNRMSQELKQARNEISELPEGKLAVRKRDNHVQFLSRTGRQQTGITRCPEIVYKLARKQFLELHTGLLEQLLEQGWTDESQRIIAETVRQINVLLGKYDDAGLEIALIIMTPNQRIWNSNRHSQKENRREELIYPTKGRVYMRSKSERFIGNLLEDLYIPYRYETRLEIHNRSYHPDFVIMLPDGRLVILEHVGRMDLRTYVEDLLVRLQAYDSIGLVVGRDVFMTNEHDTRDEGAVGEILYQMLTSYPAWNRTMKSAAVRAGCKVL